MTGRKASNKLRDKFSHFCSSPYVFGTSKKNVNAIFKSKFGGQIWTAAKASSQIKHDEAMAIIAAINCDAAEYLKNTDPKRWAKSHFPVPRFGTVTLNSAKSLNSWMKEYRDKSHLGILEIQMEVQGQRGLVFAMLCVSTVVVIITARHLAESPSID
ncbi:hypothetical protein BASA61_000671 [Batrachochytrium salamandrivorans]|nr:hypothetical protein BASA61_000671 [Batrachochytrium salamandrivorans]